MIFNVGCEYNRNFLVFLMTSLFLDFFKTSLLLSSETNVFAENVNVDKKDTCEFY